MDGAMGDRGVGGGPGFTHRIDTHGVLRVEFDRVGEPVNIFTPELLRALEALLEPLGRRADVRGLLFVSAKPGMFFAGMDVDEIAGVTDSMKGAEGARAGQQVFSRIADAEVPSVVAINGVCLGGGLEMALACDFRVAASDRKVKIGLPEVQLGIIPGFGGTQRLPRLIEVPKALDMILTGRQLDAKRAKRLGLVDLVVPPAYLEREAHALLLRAINDGTAAVRRRHRPPRSLMDRAIRAIGPVRRYALDQARQKTAARAQPKDYPAPFRAIEAIEAALTRPMPEGLDLEARIEGELIPTPTSKNLIWLFKTQTALKSATAGLPAAPRDVHRIAVLGAGIMGGGIAQLAAHNGIPVRLKDVDYDAVLTALQTASGVWRRRVRKRAMTETELRSKMGFIAPTLDYSGMRGIDLVIEAVVEKLEIKRRVLADLEERMPERAVFATNTSSIPITDIAEGALRPERVVGMHFFNPVHRMPLVEVIAGARSSPEAVETVRALAIRLGKVPVVVRDGPGFLVNRILMFYLNEASRLLADGVRIESIDPAMKAFGMPMGPFALLDQVGLDTASHVAGVVQSALGKRAQADSHLMASLVGSGRLGQKNRSGFYKFDAKGKPTKPDPSIYELIGNPAEREVPPETLQERLVLAMVNEAAICLEEGVVRQPRDVDISMIMGTGFPPFRGGLLRHADAVGIPIVVDRLRRLADAHGERFRPAGLLQEMVREQRRFYES